MEVIFFVAWAFLHIDNMIQKSWQYGIFFTMFMLSIQKMNLLGYNPYLKNLLKIPSANTVLLLSLLSISDKKLLIFSMFLKTPLRLFHTILLQKKNRVEPYSINFLYPAHIGSMMEHTEVRLISIDSSRDINDTKSLVGIIFSFW